MSTIYYVVLKGYNCGIYNNWIECKNQIDGYKNAIFRKFNNILDAQQYFETGNTKIYKNQRIDNFYKITNHSLKSEGKEISEISSIFDREIRVYTDGSSTNNGKPNARAGIGIYFGENDPRNISKEIFGKRTNNTAELTAIIEAILILSEELSSGKKINIYTDSEYAIKCCKSFGRKQSVLNWENKIPNLELVKQIYNLFNKNKNLTITHIRAHTGNNDINSHGNEEADKLANMSINDGNIKLKTSKIYLNVLYSDKDIVKSKGAQWDKSKKKWYIYENNSNKLELVDRFMI